MDAIKFTVEHINVRKKVMNEWENEWMREWMNDGMNEWKRSD